MNHTKKLLIYGFSGTIILMVAIIGISIFIPQQPPVDDRTPLEKKWDNGTGFNIYYFIYLEFEHNWTAIKLDINAYPDNVTVEQLFGDETAGHFTIMISEMSYQKETLLTLRCDIYFQNDTGIYHTIVSENVALNFNTFGGEYYVFTVHMEHGDAFEFYEGIIEEDDL